MATLQELKSKFKANNYRTSTSLDVPATPLPSLDQKNQPLEDTRNTVQKTTGLFLDPILTTGVRFGQAIGAGSLKTADYLSQGKIDEYIKTKTGKTLDQALEDELETSRKLPFTGGIIKPESTETPKTVFGRGISTVALGVGSPTLAGGLMGVGAAMEEDKSTTEIAITGIVSALGAKVLSVGLGIAAPYIEKAVAKYGTGVLEKLQAQLPEYAKPYLDDLISKGRQVVEKTSVETKPSISSKGVLKPKTLDEILTTPEEAVYKLTPSERVAYWKNKTDVALSTRESELAKLSKETEVSIGEIKQRSIEAQNKIDLDLKKQAEASVKETQALKKKVDEISVEEANSLKKPAIEIYKKNSQEFKKLFDEDFTPDKQGIKLSSDDLIAKLDNEFINDPLLNPKARLGLEPGKEITAKEFYDRVRDLNISASGSKGTNVFTQGDLAVNRTRGILTETLNENGINLSRANDFWSTWKPLQREITSKVKPFDPGYKTGTMANILKKSASETGDAKNAKFIADFEAQLGEKLPSGTKKAMEQLTAAQKKAIADKVALEEAKVAEKEAAKIAIEEKKLKLSNVEETVKKEKQAVIEDLYQREFASKQAADLRTRNRNILFGALSFAGISAGVIKTLTD